MPSFAELRAQNKAAEEREAKGQPPAEEPAEETPAEQPAAEEQAAEPAAEEPDETPAEPADEETPPAEAAAPDDDWMKPDDSAPAPVPVSNSTAKAIRLKYQAPLKEAKDELEKLKKENEELRKQKAQGTAKLPDAPKRDDFKSDDEYLVALADHRIAVTTQKTQAEQRAEQHRQRQQEIATQREKDVEDHYLRANKLVEATAKLPEGSRIKPEDYQAADHNVRTAMASIFGDAADAVTDELIAQVGPGSEKAFYNLGINRKRLNEFLDTFKRDPNGLRAVGYVTRLAEKLNAPKAPAESRAPEPPEAVHGDKQKGGQNAARMKKDWEAEHAKGNIQAAMAIRRRAAAAGVDTGAWLK